LVYTCAPPRIFASEDSILTGTPGDPVRVGEIIYRGFVTWYLGSFMPLWAAVIVSPVFFGLGHRYPGRAGDAEAFNETFRPRCPRVSPRPGSHFLPAQ
jgi:hypothetical protein